MEILKAPFPWFGGKSRVAPLVWARFGNVANYVEPFAGSLAVLLGRPTAPGVETVNDADCYLANFWRALQADPDGLAGAADWPVNEADLHARHLWLVNQGEFIESMKTDPDFFDVRVAGWWVWGISQWIGGGWCSMMTGNHFGRTNDGGTSRRRPQCGSGQGVHRKSLHLGDGGMGVNRQFEELGALHTYFRALAARLRKVHVCCGDWSRVMGPSPTTKLGLTGVFLDPPYSGEAGRDNDIYAHEDLEVSKVVRAWAIEHGADPQLRIALCGYEGEHDFPAVWQCVAWKSNGGYGSRHDGAGRENSERERIWFSPACLDPQASLFAGLEAAAGEPDLNNAYVSYDT